MSSSDVKAQEKEAAEALRQDFEEWRKETSKKSVGLFASAPVQKMIQEMMRGGMSYKALLPVLEARGIVDLTERWSIDRLKNRIREARRRLGWKGGPTGESATISASLKARWSKKRGKPEPMPVRSRPVEPKPQLRDVASAIQQPAASALSETPAVGSLRSSLKAQRAGLPAGTLLGDKS